MIGSRLGPYAIVSELGSGGMGKVYLAEVAGHAPGIEDGVKVALKVIHAHLLETPGFFKRFLREAEIGKSVEQDNVVRCYDCDALMIDGHQQNFLVMEYVEGQTLRDLLNELDRVPEELCRHIGREIAKGLVAIHDAGVIHRDLKPENVLITEDHVVKVMDLGVARLQDETIRLSQTGAFVGSLEYASPEQFRSGGNEIDARSDLHALGVVLYELSTGQHPYRTDDVSSTLKNVIEGEARRAGEVNPQLSPFFEEVIHTLAAKEPDERFASASSLWIALDEGEKCEWWRERAVTLRIQTKRPLRRIRIPRETALYGRDDELAKLHALYEKAKAGDGQVLLIEGEAGIGKTRLVDEFVGRLRKEGEDLNFLFGSYPPGGAATVSGAFSTAYREQFGSEGLADTLMEYLTVTPVLIPAFAALLRGETTPTGAEPLTKDSLQTVFTHATRALAAERPTIVLIDDLHFAPEDGRALFSSLATAVPGHRALLIGTMRPGVPEEWTANVTRLEQAELRPLARLGPKDLTRLLADAFRSERLAEELAFRIAQKSDGNPFFAFEIIRGLREGQFIRQQPDGTWVTTKVIQDIQVPSSVLDLVQARIGDLTEEAKDMLEVASCCGFQFNPLLVAAVLGLDQIPAMKALARIEMKHGLIRATGRRYVFDHHQVQENLYAGMPELLREPYHLAIAEALEFGERAADKDWKDLDGVLCVDLVDHFLKGARGERALPYLDGALAHLAREFLHDQAIQLADSILELPELVRGGRRAEILLVKAERHGLRGEQDLQHRALDEAVRSADGSGDTVLHARALLAFGVCRLLTADLSTAEEAIGHALELAHEAGDRGIEGRATGKLGNVFIALGRAEEARACHEKHLALARETGDRQGEAMATGNLGIHFYTLGRMDKAYTQFERDLALSREIGDRLGEAAAHGNLGVVLSDLGRYEEAQTQCEKHLALARETGSRPGEALATGNLGNVFLHLGNYEEALAHYGRHRALAREIWSRRGEALATGNMGAVFLLVGRMEESRAHLEEFLALSLEVKDRRLEGHALYGLASLTEHEGEQDEARRILASCLGLRRELGEKATVAETLVSQARLDASLGETHRARTALAEALTLAKETGVRDMILSATVGEARLPGGDVDAAAAAVEEHVQGVDCAVRLEACFRVWQLGGGGIHLKEAHRLLDHLCCHAPEEYRESMLKNVRLHREIVEAWEEHGAKIEKEPCG